MFKYAPSTVQSQATVNRLRRFLTRGQSVTQATVLTIVLTLGLQVLAYCNNYLVALKFGANSETDAFYLCLSISTTLMGLVGSASQNLIIPLYAQGKVANESRLKVLVTHLFVVLGIMLLILTVILVLFPVVFVKMFALGFHGEVLYLSVKLCRVLAPVGVLMVLTSFLTGIMQSDKKFLFPLLISLVGNACLIGSVIYLTRYINIYSLVIGYILTSLISFVSLLVVVRKGKMLLRYSHLFVKMDWPSIRSYFVGLLPLIVISGVYSINQMVDKSVASTLAIGSITILNFAQKIYGIPVALLLTPITNTIYPKLSDLAAKHDDKALMRLLVKSISLSIFGLALASITLMAYSGPLVNLLLRHGAFSTSDSAITARVVSIYGLSFSGLAINSIFGKATYAFNKVNTSLKINVLGVVANVALSITLGRLLGLVGVAIAFSLAVYAESFVYIVIAVRSGLLRAGMKILLVDFIKVILIFVPVASLGEIFNRMAICRFTDPTLSLLSIFIQVLILTVVYVFLHKILRTLSASFIGDILKTRRVFQRVLK